MIRLPRVVCRPRLLLPHATRFYAIATDAKTCNRRLHEICSLLFKMFTTSKRSSISSPISGSEKQCALTFWFRSFLLNKNVNAHCFSLPEIGEEIELRLDVVNILKSNEHKRDFLQVSADRPCRVWEICSSCSHSWSCTCPYYLRGHTCKRVLLVAHVLGFWDPTYQIRVLLLLSPENRCDRQIPWRTVQTKIPDTLDRCQTSHSLSCGVFQGLISRVGCTTCCTSMGVFYAFLHHPMERPSSTCARGSLTCDTAVHAKSSLEEEGALAL
ncbi:unnamed protein product (mitochondrion) [Plasmodiophora brassicae]|uniref:SWIM-type domain-containing protein n=1 Tax=Plasmodiophora brassicae TaxID=37360 RepID=A0A3P3YMM7_PLABS|nr:unnamed protein product [Plasmodiophora brassicae]